MVLVARFGTNATSFRALAAMIVIVLAALIGTHPAYFLAQ
jgi:hypothetical protein